MKIEDRYLDGNYLSQNPDWDRGDSLWKAELVKFMLRKHKINPKSICELGCGAGDILRNLQLSYPNSEIYGYDISPLLAKFWEEDKANSLKKINFVLGDFYRLNKTKHDLLLMMDVFEHVRDPYTFLEDARSHAQKFIFHIPLDLSALSVARGYPLINARRAVGHLHFYDKNIALEMLKDCGFRILDWRYTGASLNMPNRAIKTKAAALIRKIFYFLNRDLGVRFLGGDTLVVLAE